MRNRPTKAFFNAYAALYGNAEAKLIQPKKKRRNDEDREQMKFNAWFDQFLWQKDLRWFHPANGGSRNAIEGAKLKAMGVKAGVPDVICPVARKGHHGLVIEFKRVDGSMSDVRSSQKDWLDWFTRQNWEVHVCFGFEHAKKIVEAYFS